MYNIRIFTKINGELATYETNLPQDRYLEAIGLVKQELGPEHKATILALVKY
jgi:hypothetical protein